ncbi:MAG: hypothetical protein LBL87_00770 [Ruminococcus sp.]|jgi:hypothetical protein|nr:hypothetical protein [Ruminococcus sp.]
MKTKRIQIKSADLSDERIKELAAAPFEKNAASKEECGLYIGRALAYISDGH